MREIKFRAWDKERDEMRKVQLMDWSDWWVSTAHTWERGNGENALKYGERNSFRNEDTDRHILMQYTGLKDKNGKEIYEGDILEDHHKTKGKVFFYNGAFRLSSDQCELNPADMQTFDDLNDYLIEDNDLVVVGNIYENPELIADE